MLSESRIATSESTRAIEGQSLIGKAGSPTIPRIGPTEFRKAPHNLEAEQALLGAVLVNNEAMDRVSAFLEPQHFFDPLHQQIFETTARLIHDGKQATPITLRTFFETAEPISPTLTVPQYLGNLAATATTIINAEEYGRTVYDLATRRALIVRCEDAMDVAYDSPVDAPVKEQLDKLHGHIGDLLSSCGTEALYVSRCLADVEPENVSWLWGSRFARGKLNLIAGQPGQGKSQLALFMAGKASVGGEWPDSSQCPLGSVVLISCEDDAADTIVPRLMAVGADLSRVHILDWVIEPKAKKGKTRQLFDLDAHISILKSLVDRIGDVVLIVIDPISAYLAGIDSHKMSQVRGALAPLQQFAAETGAAVVLITHLNKGSADANAMARVAGSGAFVAACRSSWLVERDPQDESRQRRILTPLKNNIGDDQTGFAFQVKQVDLEEGIESSCVEFEPEPIRISASELLREQQDNDDERSALSEAMDFLREFLSDGPKNCKSTLKAAEDAGIAHRTLRRAREKLRIKPQKSRVTGLWVWALPEHAETRTKVGNDVVQVVQHDHADRTDGAGQHAQCDHLGQLATSKNNGQDGQLGHVGQGGAR
jgi:hypothetical protein